MRLIYERWFVVYRASLGEQFYNSYATSGVPVVCITTHEASYHHENGSDNEDHNILPVSTLKKVNSDLYNSIIHIFFANAFSLVTDEY